ncbi:kinesin-like protein KIF18A [Dermacentor albipictus]|uniref:kinesin-like protein KIF18A n=1 Tax=Dermacentor albipictus TaxID=60249 RepID=UPI0031FBD50B
MVRLTPATSRHPTNQESTMVPPNQCSNETAQSSGLKRRQLSKGPPSTWARVNMAVRTRLLSDRDPESAGIVHGVITLASMVRPTPAASRHPTMKESTMMPPNRRSNETAQFSVLKRRQSNKDPLSPWAWVNVVVRVRLLSYRDSETASIARVLGDRCHVFEPKAEAESFHFQEQRTRGVLVMPNEDNTFMFDAFFDETNDNVYVFRSTTKDMLTMLFEGCNCSVFICVSTCAGEPSAMLGFKECPGVITLMTCEFYQRVDKLRSEGETCDVAVTYLEVYSKVVRDLLRLIPDKGITTLKLTVRKVNESATFLELLLKGNKNWTQHATDLNAECSWSHGIFRSYVTLTENVTSTKKEIRVSMRSINLADSERAAAVSRNVKEGTKFDLSLLALGSCIDVRSNSAVPWSPGTQQVRYQDSKLTHILKDSLGVSCNTLMIGTATALKLSSTEMYNTLECMLSRP